MGIWDDFRNKYVAPRVENVIVGFSGIDPDERTNNFSEETLRALVSEYLSQITVRIDSGNVTEPATEPEVQPSPVYIPQLPSEIPHEELSGLLGGDENGHFHITAEELAKLNSYPEYAVLNALIRHEGLPDLMGGNASGHYHLTAEEIFKLQKIIEALIPAGQTEVTIPSGGTDNHEALNNLLGGDANGHYHFTEDEWTKILTLLAAVFPSGSTTPVLPSGPITPTPGGTDPSGGEDEAIPDYSALFENKEPSWSSIGLTAKYKTVKEEGRMYFGTVVKGDKVTQQALVVPTIYNNNRNDQLSLLSTSSYALTSFSELQRNVAKARGITLGDMVYAYLGITTKLNTSKYGGKRHFCFYCTYLNSTNNYIYYYGSSTSVHNPGTKNSGYLAGAYKSDAGNAGDQKIVCATGDGGVCIVGYKKDSNSSINTTVLEKGASIGMKVNPGCLCYGNGVFCATGEEGAANSAEGVNWNVNKSAPKNMVGLHYRSDFAYKDNSGSDCTGAFIACSKDTRLFYFSSDGYNWTQCSTTRVPLESVIATAYDPNNKRYCVVGSPGNVACLSQDFVNWTPTYVSKVDLNALDVIWAFDKFLLMPKDSPQLYSYAG